MKRSNIKAKTSDFQREFDAMKPLVRERSGGYCESWPFARDHCAEGHKVYSDGTLETDICTYHTIPIAGTCEFRNPIHIHHRKYRSRGGTNALSNLLHLCEPCHSWIHANPELSNKLGLSLHAGESEDL